MQAPLAHVGREPDAKSARASIAGSAKTHLRFAVELLTKSADRFDDIEGFRLGAAFSFYSTFAIFPLVLLTVTLVGYVVGDAGPTRDRILTWIATADPSVRRVMEQTLSSMRQTGGARETSAIIGLLSLLFSASGAFVELDFTLNKIWKVGPRRGVGVAGKVTVLVHERLAGFACMAGLGVFLVASLIAGSTLNALAARLRMPALLQAAEVTASIALLSLALAAAFHLVPRSRPPFRAVLGGAALTAVLLTVLKGVFAFYLAYLTRYSAYGIVGGVLALATWIYLSSQIIFFGATLTRVHGEMTGSRDRVSVPARAAER